MAPRLGSGQTDVLRNGSGGVSRQTLATTVVGGMLRATLLGIFIIPVAFYIVEKITTRLSRHQPQAPTSPHTEADHHE